FTIGQSGVFSLGGWSPHVQSTFHVRRPTRFHGYESFVYGAITHYGHTFQSVPLNSKPLKGCSPFARHYLGNLGCFLFLGVLRWFSSPGSPHTPMYSVCDTRLMTGGFPHSEIAGSKVVCHLPNAYRRLPRLSSPLTAKASTVCAYSLDHITPNNPMDCQSPGL